MSPTLEEVVHAFESWRITRVSRKETIPDRLWTMVKALVAHYKRSHIQRALGISSQQFSEYCLNQSRCDSMQMTGGFASAHLEPVASHCPDDGCELTLKGMRKSLHMKISIQQLPQVLMLVEGYL